MFEDELKVTRRLFLRHSAVATAATASLYSIAMKTDALAQAENDVPAAFGSFPDEILPYVYHE
jgi:hypothetical protein